MKRFTDKKICVYPCEVETQRNIVDKLWRLENIEEELGIDLFTLFKAIKNGIWFWTKNNNETQPTGPWKLKCDFFDRKGFVDEGEWYCEVFRFNDYRKTWALSEEELVNEH